MIRPRPARWFELWVAREDVVRVLDALAQTSAAEFEGDSAASPPSERDRADRALREFAQLSQRYRAWWPDPAPQGRATPAHPVETLEDGLRRLRGWAGEADAIVQALHAIDAGRAALDTLQQLVDAVGASPIDLGAFARAGPRHSSALYALPLQARSPLPPPDVITRTVPAPAATFVLAHGSPSAVAELGRRMAARHARMIDLPHWLSTEPRANPELIARERARLDAQVRERGARLAEINARHGLAEALADLVWAGWCCTRADRTAWSGVLARITGWTSSRRLLDHAIDVTDARALVHFPPPPRGLKPPLLLRNPHWAQPFELFPRLLGMPAQTAADPTLFLAFVVPLLFGYMFGDLGQGLLLAAAGFAFRRRWPLLRLLIPCGLSAAMFGLVFGSVFGIEGWVAPLWAHSIDAPLDVLAAPLAGGAMLLWAGLFIAALEAWWSGEIRHWFEHEVGLLLAYAGLLAAFATPAGLYAAATGVAYTLLAALVARRGASGALAALGELAKGTFQLLVNTISFVRVGAFALAHAGLSSAVGALAEGMDSIAAKVLVIVLGNVVTLAIEVLVVSVQTTRLVLFEFFTRFFIGQGREFQPVAPLAAAGRPT